MDLETRNAHPRDARVQFFEEEHVYHVDGKRCALSVSGVVHALFPQFNAKEVLDRCFPGWAGNKKSRYYPLIGYLRAQGFSDDEAVKGEIARHWSENGRGKSEYGTSIHRLIELDLNGVSVSETPPTEFAQYRAWRETRPTWKPYRTEWSVFDEDLMLAGQIDSVWVDEATGLYHMVDWKVVQDMAQKNDYGETGHAPVEDLPNTNWGHYAVQQNLYRYMLETRYGVSLASATLLQLHASIPSAREWPMPDLQARVPDILSKVFGVNPATSS